MHDMNCSILLRQSLYREGRTILNLTALDIVLILTDGGEDDMVKEWHTFLGGWERGVSVPKT